MESMDTSKNIHAVDTATGAEAAPEVSSARAKAIFAKIAPKYDKFNAISSMGIYRLWLRTVVAEAQATPATRMLDLAAGTGDVTFAICKATPPRFVMSTDFSPEMLEVARRRYANGEAHGVPCTFEVVDAQQIPYGDESFDLVTCAYGIRNMPEREKALAEAYRVLGPGGRYVILEFTTPPNPAWRKIYSVYLKNMIPAVGGALTGDRSGFVYLNDSIRAFPDQETFARMLRSAGFSKVTYRNLSGGIAAVHTAIK